jgi:hypothetical protein
MSYLFWINKYLFLIVRLEGKQVLIVCKVGLIFSTLKASFNKQVCTKLLL